MAEVTGGDVFPTTMSKRSFLKLLLGVPAVAAGAVAGVNVGRQEKTKIQEGWFEHNGIRYFPMYEAHREGPTKDLPKEVDTLFCEVNIPTNSNGYTIYNIPADILAEALPYYRDVIIPSRQIIFAQAKLRKIPFAVGDVRGDPAFDQKYSVAEIERALGITNKEDRGRFWNGVFISVVTQLPEKLQQTIFKRATRGMSRRDFLKLMAGSAAAAALSVSGFSLGIWAATDTQYFKGMLDNPDYPPGVAELLNRLGSFANNMHPEDETTFLGDLFMAHKIEQVGQWLKHDKELPMVAYNVGAGHNGIENMIMLPSSIRRVLMISIHRQLVGRMKDEYGFYMATTRVIQADEQGLFGNKVFLPDEKLMDMLGIEKPAG